MRLSSYGRTNQVNKLKEAGEQSQSGLCEFTVSEIKVSTEDKKWMWSRDWLV